MTSFLLISVPFYPSLLLSVHLLYFHCNLSFFKFSFINTLHPSYLHGLSDFLSYFVPRSPVLINSSLRWHLTDHPSIRPFFSFPPFSSFSSFLTADIRLRVRAEYSEHESALRARVSSDKQQPLERQFELFSRASLLLRARDLGSIVCDIKFSELQNLDAFWADYLSGALLEALKGVFITDSLKRAAGQEGVRLLVSVDQDDYEEGRKLLLNNQTHSTASGPVHR